MSSNGNGNGKWKSLASVINHIIDKNGVIGLLAVLFAGFLVFTVYKQLDAGNDRHENIVEEQQKTNQKMDTLISEVKDLKSVLTGMRLLSPSEVAQLKETFSTTSFR